MFDFIVSSAYINGFLVLRLVLEHGDGLLGHLEWISVSAPPSRRARAVVDNAEEGIRAEPEEASQKWSLALAQALARTTCGLLRELLAKTIITYYVEWCETPDPRQPSFCLHDACFTFKKKAPYIESVGKSPDNHCYLNIPHALKDPVDAVNQSRMQSFHCTTFWDNLQAYEATLAAQALTLMGRNVDRAFWSKGPGGVGQSLESHRIANLFGPLHAFLDMNIYYSDDELRKQCENIAGKGVVTGQEAEDGRQGLKQDLYKKHISADPVPGRLPYSIVTRLIELVGWKRFETNRVMRFSGITEEIFLLGNDKCKCSPEVQYAFQGNT